MILVGHSYSGVVITEAGNDPKVAGLVHIAAFAPDKGESVAALIKDPPPGMRHEFLGVHYHSLTVRSTRPRGVLG